MSKIKYRVYIKPLKRYAKDYETILYHHQCNMEPSWTVNISPDEYYGDEDLTVEQFTGLLDRNGKEIYEGDIVRTTNRVRVKGMIFLAGVVEFKQQAFWICNVPSERPDFTHNETLLQYWETDLEVIGNIHESNMEKLCQKEV